MLPISSRTSYFKEPAELVTCIDNLSPISLHCPRDQLAPHPQDPADDIHRVDVSKDPAAL